MQKMSNPASNGYTALRRLADWSREKAEIALHNTASLVSRNGLVVLDDYFPNLRTSFRISEFNYYLNAFADSVVYSCDRSLREDLAVYKADYPNLASRIHRFDTRKRVSGRLAYCVFLNNAYGFISLLDGLDLPLVFTLYPGGGFGIDSPESDLKLRRVCSSPNLKKIIVTQQITHDYLKRQPWVDMDCVEFIYGGVFPSDVFNSLTITKRRYPDEKSVFDICFVAYKYMAGGIDKGFDIFIETANLIARRLENARFHVVGGFEESDMDCPEIKDRITFWGIQFRDFFRDFYTHMDIILSPNVAFQMYPGSFDGFPTGACIEAGLSGVAVFCSDPLGSNVALRNHEEIEIISRDPAEIADLVCSYHSDPERLKQISLTGQRAFATLFDIENQMKRRCALFQ